jgi:hypothetical protein
MTILRTFSVGLGTLAVLTSCGVAPPRTTPSGSTSLSLSTSTVPLTATSSSSIVHRSDSTPTSTSVFTSDNHLAIPRLSATTSLPRRTVPGTTTPRRVEPIVVPLLPTVPTVPAPSTTSPKEYTITCWDGREIIQWWPPTDEEQLFLCGHPPATTLPQPPSVSRVEATYGNGLSWLGGGSFATPESCPTSTTIRYTATIVDGSTADGSVTITATTGVTAYAPVILPGGQTITFSIYLMAGGGCLRGVMW